MASYVCSTEWLLNWMTYHVCSTERLLMFVTLKGFSCPLHWMASRVCSTEWLLMFKALNGFWYLQHWMASHVITFSPRMIKKKRSWREVRSDRLVKLHYESKLLNWKKNPWKFWYEFLIYYAVMHLCVSFKYEMKYKDVRIHFGLQTVG